MLKVMLVDEVPERAERARRTLESLGCEVVCEVRSTWDLARIASEIGPDLIIIDTESPSRDTLEHLCEVSRHQPRPVVMFAHDGDKEKIRAAIRAGVSAYVVDTVQSERLMPIIDAAVASFQEYQAVRDELREATQKLNERKCVERAKGILMKQRGMSEEDAYHALRKLAMTRNQRIGEVAQQVIAMADLIG
jgi:response regulator NasT